jgi:hypothetical protein
METPVKQNIIYIGLDVDHTELDWQVAMLHHPRAF